MKSTSIAIAILVAASQISSTFGSTGSSVPAGTFPSPIVVPNQVSAAAAVGSVRGGLFNAAAFSRASPNPGSLTAILGPISEGGTSNDVVRKSFFTIFDGFFNTLPVRFP
jgi:hypothetical protein